MSKAPLPRPVIQLTSPDGSCLGPEEAEPWQKKRSARASGATPSQLLATTKMTTTNTNRSASETSKELGDQQHELTVCDIIGDWGRYQWSLCLFALLYSALAAIPVIFGPLLTPEMAHVCQTGSNEIDTSAQLSDKIAIDRHECFVGANAPNASAITTGESLIMDNTQRLIAIKCSSFLYNNLGFGLLLTNGFDLVCDRRWLRSLVSSSALAGMLISSVTLGLFSDKFGRLRCIQVSFVVSGAANLVAILTGDYFLFCFCVALMSFARVGAANALCTLLMEATSPRFRYVPVFQYGVGWSLGTMFVTLLNSITLDYRLLMGALLIWQLLMLPWLYFGVSESIRWLLSEGHFNRAQIELRRACCMNKVQADTKLAKSIACIEVQQVRKASRIISHEQAPMRLAQAIGADLEDTTRELDMLSSAIRKSFFGEPDLISCASGSVFEGAQEQTETGQTTTSEPVAEHNKLNDNEANLSNELSTTTTIPIAELSPTLSRMSFSLPAVPITPGVIVVPAIAAASNNEQAIDEPTGVKFAPNSNGPAPIDRTVAVIKAQKSRSSLSLVGSELNSQRGSFTTQGLIQLAMKYSKTVESEDQGRCFIVQMFHKKLWRSTLVLLLTSILFETAYYGLVQTSKFVGQSMSLNYVTGALGELGAAFVSCLLLAFLSRRFSLIACSLLAALVCLCMALSYQLIPDNQQVDLLATNLTTTLPQTLPATNSPPQQPVDVPSPGELVDNDANLEPISTLTLLNDEEKNEGIELGERNLTKHLANELHLADNKTTDVLNVKLSIGMETKEPPLMASRERNLGNLLQFRQTLNFWLMNLGKFVISCGIQVAATIAMEAYPNNLRQTGSGVLVSAGRIGSIVAPFLFNDSTPDRHIFRWTLTTLGVVGLLICCLIPVAIRDQKDKELCDKLNEIE